MKGYVPSTKYNISLGKSKKILVGNHITIVSMSYMTVEAINSAKLLKHHGINCEVIDLRTVSPIDYKIIFNSVKKTKRLLVLDTSNKSVSIASEIVSSCSENVFNHFVTAPKIIALPDLPVPTSYGMTKDLYPDSKVIIKEILNIMNIKHTIIINESNQLKHDIPHEKFKGPF